MKTMKMFALAALTAAGLVAGALPEVRVHAQQQPAPEQGDNQSFRFKTGVELINVTATVTDENGRFVPNLQQDDFRVYQDGEPQPITHFNAERVPVSLGIVLDTSGSMEGEKMAAARDALDRFSVAAARAERRSVPVPVRHQPGADPGMDDGQAPHRLELSADAAARRNGDVRRHRRSDPARASPGTIRKKALVIISDGNDTSSSIDVLSVKRLIRESEVLVYAIGIDGQGEQRILPIGIGQGRPRPPRCRCPFLSRCQGPSAGRRRPSGPMYPPGSRGRGMNDDRVNAGALREITDDSGGRTEIIRSPRDLDPATAGIADELSRQYYLGYAATGVKDGQWHTISVELRNPDLPRARTARVRGDSIGGHRCQSSSQFPVASSSRSDWLVRTSDW